MRNTNTIAKPCFIMATIALVMVAFVFPIVMVFVTAFGKGVSGYLSALNNEETLEAVRLSVLVVFIAVPINLVFGVAASWCLAKFSFRGKSFLMALIDLPLSISPVISGFMFLSIFGIESLIGGWLYKHDIQIIFAVPAIVITTLFITLPFMARELIPIMIDQGNEQEEAAVSLGANGFKTFILITLPNIKWGILYGLLLSLSRAFGEFGAVSVISGHIRGETTTIPIYVEILYNEYNYVAAFAVASILALLAMITLIVKKYFIRT